MQCNLHCSTSRLAQKAGEDLTKQLAWTEGWEKYLTKQSGMGKRLGMVLDQAVGMERRVGKDLTKQAGKEAYAQQVQPVASNRPHALAQGKRVGAGADLLEGVVGAVSKQVQQRVACHPLWPACGRW